jgi:hypothetical protein
MPVTSSRVNELTIPNHKRTWTNIRKIADAPRHRRADLKIPGMRRNTQKPFSGLWNVTRSTKPAGISVELAVDVRAIPRMMERKIRGRHSHRGDQHPTAQFRRLHQGEAAPGSQSAACFVRVITG